MSTRNVTYGPVRSSEALLRANALMAVRLKEQVANLEAIKASRNALIQKYKALDFRIEVILDAIKTIDND